MFRDRIFSISFLISLFGHLFWMTVITVITVPTGLSLGKYTKVSFLGPILEKTAFELMLDESNARFETLYRRPIMPKYTFEVEIDSPTKDTIGLFAERRRPFDFTFSPRSIFRESKATMPYFFKEGASSFQEVPESESSVRRRAVVFKPDEIPRVPARIAKDRKRFRVQFKFIVSPDGSVENVRPVVSSGYPQVDMIGMDYLRKWRFTPLRASDKQNGYVETLEIEMEVD